MRIEIRNTNGEYIDEIEDTYPNALQARNYK